MMPLSEMWYVTEVTRGKGFTLWTAYGNLGNLDLKTGNKELVFQIFRRRATQVVKPDVTPCMELQDLSIPEGPH